MITLSFYTLPEQRVSQTNPLYRSHFHSTPFLYIQFRFLVFDETSSSFSGQPKAVLSTNRQFLTSLMNAGLANGRSYLRRGETPPAPDPNARQRAILLGVPLFHAIGLQSSLTSCTAVGGKVSRGRLLVIVSLI